MIKIGQNIILNGDLPKDYKDFDFSNLCLITCGLSLRSTITASSIDDDGFTYCLQRSIFTINNQEVSPQEFNVRWKEKAEDIYPYLEVVTLLLLCGISVKIFESIQL